MRSRILRAILVLIALASQVAAGYFVWRTEEAIAAERGAADTFDRQARALALGFSELRAAFQAYVADGQNTTAWQKTAEDLQKFAAGQVRALGDIARSPEAQGSIEDAIEQAASLAKTDARAKDYLASGQRLSASDVVFAEAAPITHKAANAIDVARGQESVFAAGTLERLRLQQLYLIGGAAAVTVIVLLVLLPVPKARRAEPDEEEALATTAGGSGLGLSQVAPARARESRADEGSGGAGLAAPAPAAVADPVAAASAGIDLTAAAEVCAALARVQEPRELPGLLERAAGVLGADGLVIWMPDGPQGALRPALAHGYPPLTVTRMGTIPIDDDNATALAFRTSTTQVLSAEAGGTAAVAAPLVTPDGCSGVMAAEIGAAVDPDHARALATIIAAQLATLISPTQPAAQRPGP